MNIITANLANIALVMGALYAIVHRVCLTIEAVAPSSKAAAVAAVVDQDAGQIAAAAGVKS